jgi:hypothetical protein
MVDLIRGFNLKSTGSGIMQVPQPLTDEQKSQVKSILSNYDPSNISSDDARTIFKSFRDAGIRPASGLKETIAESGFNSEQLRTLARSESNLNFVSENTASTSSGINMSSLQSLATILSKYDLENMSSDEQKELYAQLNEEGLLRSGSLIDLSA